jgi:hypothetical protein
MEAITRIVSESLARHGFDRPLDYRRLRWSRWFRCESHHSLLVVPSRPGVFAIAEEITPASADVGSENAAVQRRMLAVTQFFADDDMAYVLDRMLSVQNPMRTRLLSGRYFVRFVVIEDEAQRRSICNALNQWIAGTGENASGIGAHFAASLEPAETNVARAIETRVVAGDSSAKERMAPQFDSAADLHCPTPFPSGF